MAQKQLIVIHGMGTHDESSVVKEVTDAFQTVFTTYASLKDMEPKDEFDIVALEYNSFFDNYRNAISGRGDVIEELKSVSGNFPLLPNATAAIASLDESLTEDRLFSTHWLDVILYRYSLLAEPIRLKIAEAIATAVRDKGSSNVHVLGHSLGTSILHDSLAKLYGPSPGVTNLSNTSNRLGGVHQVANVSRLLQSFSKVGASEVRPGIGCCTVYLEYRHKLDPFTKFKPFDPLNNGDWVSQNVYQSAYRLVEPSEVIEANVHSLTHYLRNPDVHLPILKMLCKFRPNAEERTEAKNIYLSQTLQGKASAVREAYEDFDYSDTSIQHLLTAAKTLKDIVESFGESF